MLTSKAAQALLTLLEKGVCNNTPEFAELAALGLWHLSPQRKTLIASQRLLVLRQSLSNDQEAVAAILATQPAFAKAWACIVAAHLKDVGSRDDINALAEQINQLEAGAQQVLNQLSEAALTASPFGEIEALLLGQGAEQSASYPKLLRALANAAHLTGDNHQPTAVTLTEIDKTNVANAWQQHRMIGLPSTTAAPANPFQLTGYVASPSDAYSNDSSIQNHGCLGWLLANPWAFLLAQVVDTQDMWRSERITGGLQFEIDPSQTKYFMQPALIDVVVTTLDDAQVSCGSLGQFLLRVLAALNIQLFTALPTAQHARTLDAALAPIIGLLIEAKVWQYIQGSSNDTPHYQQHPDFGDMPTSRIGTIHFARPGKVLTKTIREQAELWADELRNYSPAMTN
jgi:hypothetical protein